MRRTKRRMLASRFSPSASFMLRTDSAQIEMLHNLDAAELHQPFVIKGAKRAERSAALKFFLARPEVVMITPFLPVSPGRYSPCSDHIGEACTEHSVEIAFQHGGKAAPPERRDQRQHVRATDCSLLIADVLRRLGAANGRQIAR